MILGTLLMIVLQHHLRATPTELLALSLNFKLAIILQKLFFKIVLIVFKNQSSKNNRKKIENINSKKTGFKKSNKRVSKLETVFCS